MSPAMSTRTAATVEAPPPLIPPPAGAPGEKGIAKLPRNSSLMARFASTLQSAEPVDAGAPWGKGVQTRVVERLEAQQWCDATGTHSRSKLKPLVQGGESVASHEVHLSRLARPGTANNDGTFMRPPPCFHSSNASPMVVAGHALLAFSAPAGATLAAVAVATSLKIFAAVEAVRPMRTARRLAAADSTSGGSIEPEPIRPTRPDNRSALLDQESRENRGVWVPGAFSSGFDGQAGCAHRVLGIPAKN